MLLSINLNFMITLDLQNERYVVRILISSILSTGDKISQVFSASISDVIFSFPFGNLSKHNFSLAFIALQSEQFVRKSE